MLAPMKPALSLLALAGFGLGQPAAAQSPPLDRPPSTPAIESAAAAPAPAVPPTAPGAPPIPPGVPAAAPGTAAGTPAPARSDSYSMEEIVTAADGAFGAGTEAVARVIEQIFADLGEPNAYIVGREGGGALVFGLRYGSGTLYSKIEGEQTVYWTGPSIGVDVGGDASRSFVLVYNLYDTAELFHRYPAVEGKAYLVGGVSANYHQRGRVILVPIRLGVGWRLGANVGYLKYSRELRVLPF